MSRYQLFDRYAKEWHFSAGILQFKVEHRSNQFKFLLKPLDGSAPIQLTEIVGIPGPIANDFPALIRFIENANVHISQCSDNTYKVYANPKLRGRGNVELNAATF